jgi:phosphohistidine swiveling domain-containing protein
MISFPPENELQPGKMEVVVSRPYVPLMTDLFMRGYADPKNYERLFLHEYYARMLYANGKFYYGPEAAGFGEAMYLREQGDTGFILRAFENVYRYGEELLEFSKRIRSTNYEARTSADLLQEFQVFIELYETFSVALMGYNIQFPVEREVRALVEDRPGCDDDVAILTSPRKKNIAALEQENLFALGAELAGLSVYPESAEELPQDIRERIQHHIFEYGWTNTRLGVGEPWTEQEVLLRINESGPDHALKLASLQDHARSMDEQTKALLAKIPSSPYVQNVIDTAKELVYFRTYRTDYLNKTFFNVRPLLTAIATEKNLSLEDLLLLRVEEIQRNDLISRDELNRRKIDYASMTLRPHEVLFTSETDEIRSARDLYCVAEASSTVQELRGTIANKGTVQGKVKIVLSKADLSKVEQGDILIAPMTTPDMISGMQRSAAFVTDEGGITCHAAIVSREMKKPCIIGTKIATQVFKDGDMVEVDANAGIVRKL